MYEYISSVNNIYVLMDGTVKGLISIAQPNIETKIQSFANLASGWDYGHGGPISASTVRLAQMWSRVLRNNGFLEIDAFPGGDGEIVVSACHNDHYYEVIIEPDHTISIAYDFKGKQMYYKPNMSELDAKQAILEAVGRIWSAFDYSTQINLILNKINLHGQLLEIQRAMGAYQSLTTNALSSPEHQFAPIFVNTIKTFQVLYGNPQFFGSLTQIYCQ
jgi:hypothetical protein